MTWLAVLAVYALLVAVYCLGHQLGYSKGRRIGRREGWMASEGFRREAKQWALHIVHGDGDEAA